MIENFTQIAEAYLIPYHEKDEMFETINIASNKFWVLFRDLKHNVS